MASLFKKFESTFHQRMSTVEAFIKNSVSDIKSKFLEIQKNCLITITVTKFESNKGQGEQNCKKKVSELKTN